MNTMMHIVGIALVSILLGMCLNCDTTMDYMCLTCSVMSTLNIVNSAYHYCYEASTLNGSSSYISDPSQLVCSKYYVMLNNGSNCYCIILIR